MNTLKLPIVDRINDIAQLQIRFEELNDNEFEQSDEWKLSLFRYCLSTFRLNLIIGELFFQGDTPSEYFKREHHSDTIFPLGIHEGAFYQGISYLLDRAIDDHELTLAIDSGCVIGLDSVSSQANDYQSLVGLTTRQILPILGEMHSFQVMALFGHDGLRFDLYLDQSLLPMITQWM